MLFNKHPLTYQCYCQRRSPTVNEILKAQFLVLEEYLMGLGQWPGFLNTPLPPLDVNVDVAVARIATHIGNTLQT